MSVKRQAEEALARTLGEEFGALDRDSRAENLRTVVVQTVHEPELGAALEDIRGSDGRELAWKDLPDGRRQPPKLHSAYSSCGLALNTFGPWRSDPTSLIVAGHADYTELSFEKELRIFRGGRAPNLDVVLTGSGRTLAIELKLTEHLGRKQPPNFSDAYERLASRVDPSWWAMYRNTKSGTESFEYLDAGQLVKHYFGLQKHCTDKGDREATLLYLYWEPEDADRHPELGRHSEEVARFSAAVSDPVVAFEPLTHATLWSSWDELNEPAWLREHVAELRTRYAVRLV